MKNKLTRKEKEILYRAALFIDLDLESFTCHAIERAAGNPASSKSDLQHKYADFFDLEMRLDLNSYSPPHFGRWDNYQQSVRVLMLLLFAEVGPL